MIISCLESPFLRVFSHENVKSKKSKSHNPRISKFFVVHHKVLNILFLFWIGWTISFDLCIVQDRCVAIYLIQTFLFAQRGGIYLIIMPLSGHNWLSISHGSWVEVEVGNTLSFLYKDRSLWSMIKQFNNSH